MRVITGYDVTVIVYKSVSLEKAAKCQAVFDKLKVLLVSVPVLAYPIGLALVLSLF